tara:strand:- start:488 stop:772 length:285 start_codon:yes stop_codon:yes gene_type:complete
VKQAKFIVIPAVVRADRSLPDGAKILYGDIKALSNKHGYCFASNGHFAKLFGKTDITISNWISKLKKAGFITVNYNPHRRIFIAKKKKKNSPSD